MSFDFRLFQFFHDLTGQEKILDWLFVFLAKFLPYFLVLIFLFVIWRLAKRSASKWLRRLYYTGFSIFSLLLSWLMLGFIRVFFPRPRPFVDLNVEPLITYSTSAALPSGHATAFFTLAFILLFIFKKRKVGWLYQDNQDVLLKENRKGIHAALWFFVAVTFMGIARVAVGVHWPLDIIAGFLVAFLSVFITQRFLSLSR